jgi:hypothetical protein
MTAIIHEGTGVLYTSDLDSGKLLALKYSEDDMGTRVAGQADCSEAPIIALGVCGTNLYGVSVKGDVYSVDLSKDPTDLSAAEKIFTESEALDNVVLPARIRCSPNQRFAAYNLIKGAYTDNIGIKIPSR